MAYTYDLSNKVYTDVPMLDEIMHNIKLILQDIVIKDEEEANNNETAESINDGELYVSCIDGTANIHSFAFTRARLNTINEAMIADPDCGLTPWTEKQIDEFAKSKEVIPEEYYDFMVQVATKDFIDNYEEKNNYYRMLAGMPNYNTPDLYIDIDYIPKKYYRSFIEPGIDNRAFVENDPVKYYYASRSAYVKATRNEGRYQKDPLVEDEYISDSHVKYIFDEEKLKYVVNNQTRYALVDGNYVVDENGDYIKLEGYYNRYVKGPQLYIRNSDYIDGSKNTDYFKILAQRYLYRVSLTQLTPTQLAILHNSGVIAKLAEDFPERRYINYMGAKSIDFYTARKAKNFEAIYVPSVEELVRDRFMDIYEKERMIYLKRYYSLAYKTANPLYDKFFIVLIVAQVVTDMVAETPEWYIRRDVFDLRTCQYILEAHGVKFFRTIPLKFQIAMVRKLNQLIKYKSTTQCFYDLAKIFGLEDVTIYKHYLVKTNNTGVSLDLSENTVDLDGGRQDFGIEIVYLEGNEVDGGYPDVEEKEYTYTTDKDGGRPLWDTNFDNSEDLLAKFTLYFLRVPIGGTLDNYIHDEYYRLPYDTVTTYDSDPYWDGENDHETLKY